MKFWRNLGEIGYEVGDCWWTFRDEFGSKAQDTKSLFLKPYLPPTILMMNSKVNMPPGYNGTWKCCLHSA